MPGYAQTVVAGVANDYCPLIAQHAKRCNYNLYLIAGDFSMQRLLIAITAFLAAGSANALQVGDRVDNFRLLDHRGASHELYYLSDMKAVVLLAQRNDCDAAATSIAQIDRIRRQYRDRGVVTFMINADKAGNRDAIARDIATTDGSTPVLMDPLQLISESLDLRRSGEALVIDPKSWKLTYRGGIDGASAAVDSTLTGQSVTTRSTAVKGCKIKLTERNKDRAHAKISYEKTIAQMLIDKCVTCHRQGGIGPFQMSSYAIVRGFAPMIREVLRTERMPPWHADPHYGAFSNDRSLTAAQTKTLVHWIEAGAPKSKRGTDPLAAYAKSSPEWAMGTPDLVVEIPAFNVQATGSIPYQRPIVKNTLGKDVWLKAIEFAPTNRGVVHH
ncbi:MAG TPA: redoxin domain-containing protein, partial [Steroidobacteraceae bacterium]|nr:redoxin domain-containing protein [Steroidobacteraceae bacterium]